MCEKRSRWWRQVRIHYIPQACAGRVQWGRARDHGSRFGKIDPVSPTLATDEQYHGPEPPTLTHSGAQLNGTYINGIRITPNTAAALRLGDRITFGAVGAMVRVPMRQKVRSPLGLTTAVDMVIFLAGGQNWGRHATGGQHCAVPSEVPASGVVGL
jgi:hypothetical protein